MLGVVHSRCPKHILHPEVAKAKLDTVYLDTTYLNPQYCFPPQPLVIQACAELARKIACEDESVKGEPKVELESMEEEDIVDPPREEDMGDDDFGEDMPIRGVCLGFQDDKRDLEDVKPAGLGEDTNPPEEDLKPPGLAEVDTTPAGLAEGSARHPDLNDAVSEDPNAHMPDEDIKPDIKPDILTTVMHEAPVDEERITFPPGVNFVDTAGLPQTDTKPDITQYLDTKPDIKPDIKPHPATLAYEAQERSVAMMSTWLKKDASAAEPRVRGRVLVLIGTYSIGKERIVKGEFSFHFDTKSVNPPRWLPL